MLNLSVLIPTYNRAPLLERCLRSVFATPLSNLEVLVADNASPDNTTAVVQSFANPRLRSWRNPTNLGFERSVMGLLRAARGRWVLFVTDDDFVLPGALERLADVLRANEDVGFLLSNLKQSREDGTSLSDYRFGERGGKFAAGFEALTRLIGGTHILSRLTFRREWLDLDGAERHLASMYPQMFLAGAVLKEHPGYYLDECLIGHTVGNRTFWEYPPDFMIGTRIRLVEDLLPGPIWRRERATLTNQLIAEISRHHLPIVWTNGEWRSHQRVLWQIPQVRLSPRYWYGVGRFLFTQTRRGLKNQVKRLFHRVRT